MLGEYEQEQKLEHIMEQYSTELMRTAYILLKNQQDAEEAVSDTFMKYYVNQGNFRGESSLKTYLVAILINQCRQKMRTPWYKRMLFFHGGKQEEQKSDGVDDSQGVVERLAMAELIEQLSVAEKEVFLLHYYHDLSVKEVAQALKMKEGTVKSHLHRGRTVLRKLGKEGEYV